jgi:large subunit ribosomal protein L10
VKREMANKAVIAQKEAKVKELSETLKNSKLVLLVDYRGTTVEDDTKLRKDLREAKGCAKVVKNNILKRALEMNNESELDDLLEGPVAVVTAEEDYLAPLKVVYKFTTKHDNYKIKGGIIDGKVMSVEDIVTLAKLPSREELLSKLAGSLLQTIAKVAVALDQVRAKKEAEGAEAPKAEPVAEAAAPAPAAE